MSNPSHVGLGESLALGFRLTLKAPGVAMLALGSELASVLLRLGLSTLLAVLAVDVLEAALGSVFSSLASGQPGPSSFPWSTFVGLLLASSGLVLLLRLIWLAEGARVFSARVRGGLATPGLGMAGGALPRALLSVLLLVPLEAAAMLFGATVIGASGIAWLRAARAGSGGVLASAALALALLLALGFAKAVDVIFRLTIVRAVGSRLGPVRALGSAAGLVLARLGAFAGLLVVFGILEALAATVTSFGGATLVGAGGATVGVGVALRLLTALLGSLLVALLATAELGAYTAIDAGESGEIVRPAAPRQAEQQAPPPAPILESEQILATEVVLETRPG